MKIVFLSDDFPPQSFGGAGISTYELAAGLKKAGHEVFVITTCRKKAGAGESDYNGLKIFKIQSDYPGQWRAYLSLYNPPVVRQVRDILKKIKPDIVHANNIHFYISYYSLKLAKQYARAVVFTARDTMTVTYGKLETKKYLENFDGHKTWLDDLKRAKKRWNPLRNFIIKKYFRYVDQTLAVSAALAKALEQNGIKNVKVLHTGSDLSDWQVSPAALENFRLKYGLKGKKVLLFNGRLSTAKGGQKVLDVLAEISKDVPEVVVLVVGAVDDYAKQMQAEAEKMGVGKQLIFTGWIEREEVKLSFAAADVVLVPSLYLDPFPRVTIEAMAAGRPVVGTCYGGTPEIVVDGVTGYVVNPFETEKMAGKILDLLKNPQRAQMFGGAGAERIKEKFNIADKIQDLISIYKTALEKS